MAPQSSRRILSQRRSSIITPMNQVEGSKTWEVFVKNDSIYVWVHYLERDCKTDLVR